MFFPIIIISSKGFNMNCNFLFTFSTLNIYSAIVDCVIAVFKLSDLVLFTIKQSNMNYFIFGNQMVDYVFYTLFQFEHMYLVYLVLTMLSCQ